MTYIDRLMSKDEVMGYDLICFDRDGTIVAPVGDPDDFVNGLNFDLLPGRKRCLMGLSPEIPIAICSNQGGIAAGYKNRDQLILEAGFLSGLADYPVLQIYCPAPVGSLGSEAIVINSVGVQNFQDPELAAIGYRKPRPGMLILAAKILGISQGAKCLFVGDRPEDVDAGESAGESANELDQDRTWDCVIAWNFPWESFD